MKALEEMIIEYGEVLSGDVLKVGSFLNQQVDTSLLNKMADEVAQKFAKDNITKVITVEASGIAFCFAVASKLNVNMVYAKKSASNVSGEVYKTCIHSYTHNTDNFVVVPKSYISESDKLLIVDDFLANGKAIEGLIDIIRQANASLAGCVSAIEKGYQGGGDKLRNGGIRVESLAIIDSMENGKIVFRK